jgi:Rrf2 family protein
MLSTTSEYALRALTHLARLPRGGAMLGRELAKEAEIPANYLSKILLTLRNAGLVATARGSGGGYWLLRPPDAIHLVDVVDLFDGPATRTTCVLGHHKACDDSNSCSAHDAWKKVRLAYAEFLEATTLAEISTRRVHRPTPIVELEAASIQRPRRAKPPAEAASKLGGPQP